jgi:hypothetical protein
MRSPATLISALVGALAVCWTASAQRPEFDVASVKTSAGVGDFQFIPRHTGDCVSIHNTHIGGVITYAYSRCCTPRLASNRNNGGSRQQSSSHSNSAH